MLSAACFDLANELIRPSLVDREDIIGDPHDIGVITLLQHEHLVDNIFGRPLPMRMTKNFARTPRAMKRAAARGDQ